MKQVWVNAATWSRTASTTAGALLPTVVTAMPEPRSMNELPSTSTTTPPPAAAAYTGMTLPTPAETAAERRAASSRERGPGTSVTRRRTCGRVGPPSWAAVVAVMAAPGDASGWGAHPTVGRPRPGRKGRSAPPTDGDGAELRLLVDHLLRAGEDPGERVAQAVAPVLPGVAVARLAEPHRHARRLEGRHHRPVGRDQRLEHPAADEQAVGDPPGPGPVAVHELHHRVEHRATAVVGPGDVGEDERARHQRERAVGVGRAVGGRERGHRAEAGAEQAPAGALPDQRQLGLQVRQQLPGEEPAVGGRIGVLDEPVARPHERH